MIVHPAVMVIGLADAGAVLAEGQPATLLSAPGAALSGGCQWWRDLADAARALHPGTPCLDILDCADAPGAAMAALRVGQALLILDPACPAFRAVAGAAERVGARVLAARPRALDLTDRRARQHLAAWLRGTMSPGPA